MKLNKLGGGIAVVLAATLAVSALPFSGITAFADDSDLTGNTMLTADELKFDKVVSGTIDGVDNDWYSFTITEPSKVNLICQGDSTIGYELYDGAHDNSVIDNADLKSIVNTYYLTAGTYYVHLYWAYTSPAYDLKVSATPCKLSVPGDGSNNAIGDSAAVEFDKEYNAQISQNDNIDYYTFELEKDGRVTFNFDAAFNACDWSLFDNQKDLIKHGTYQKINEKDSKITKDNSLVLKAGKYYVSLAANDKAPSYGPYTFSFDYLEKYNDTAVNGIIAFGDINHDGKIDAKDASVTLAYYSYLSTGGTETDMNKWIEDTSSKSEK
jgi:hypothetical protein